MTDFATLILTPSEASWLETACPYLTPTYLAYLSAYRYKPEQVKVTYVPVTPDDLFGHVEIEVVGPWVETILWEVPLMATLSETFFQSVVTDWNYDNQYGARAIYLPSYRPFVFHPVLLLPIPFPRPSRLMSRICAGKRVIWGGC